MQKKYLIGTILFDYSKSRTLEWIKKNLFRIKKKKKNRDKNISIIIIDCIIIMDCKNYSNRNEFRNDFVEVFNMTNIYESNKMNIYN